MLSKFLSKPNKKMNILSTVCHERYQNNMKNVNANFYLLTYPNSKEWYNNYAELPENHFILPNNYDIRKLNLDFCLSHSRYGHFQILDDISRKLNIPLITMEHTLPVGISKEQYYNMKNMRGIVDLFITEYNKNAWGFSEEKNCFVINHGIDTSEFVYGNEERNKVILSVNNDFINRDYCLNFSLYKKITSGLPTFPVGDTPGLSKSAESVEQLISFYQKSEIFINTANASPVPMSLLEAMACGCAVVSLKTCAVPEFIINGYNGILFSSEEEGRSTLEKLLNDQEYCRYLGKNAAKTIKQKYNVEVFTANWNEVLKKVYESQINFI